MHRIQALWHRGLIGKAAVVSAGVVGVLVICCIFGWIVGPQRPAATVEVVEATIAATEVVVPAATVVPTVASPTAEPTALPPTVAPPPGYVSRALMGDKWPLTIEEGRLRCIQGAVIFDAGGTTYAINGTAKARKTYADIAPIWVDDPRAPGLKKDLTPLLDRGLALC